MAASSDPTSRKPSGSSSRSGGHSPSGSPGDIQGQRKHTGNNMLGVGMGTPRGLNNGWQSWGTNTPYKRGASISSAAGVLELSSVQGDGNHSWASARSASGTWEDANGSPQKAEYGQLRTPHSAGFPNTRVDDRSPGLAKPSHFSPQRFDNGVNKDSAVPRYASAASPPFGSSSPYSGQQAPQNSTVAYDPMQTSTIVENELTLGLRGMAVEDDYGAAQQGGAYRQQTSGNQPSSAGGHGHPSLPPIRAPVHIQQSRGPYSAYGQADYAQYYTGQPIDPSVYASSSVSTGTSPASVYNSPAMYFDYSGSGRAPVYYPAQPMVYHRAPAMPSPMLTPQLPAAVPATLADKKREMQYNVQQHQQLSSQGLVYPGLRSSPSPHQSYAPAIDYASQMPLMLPGATMYGGVNAQAMHMYHQGVNPGRRKEHGGVALRSPLLDEFRANKARKWELRDIQGHVVEFSGDQHGSRFIQQKLESASSEEKQFVFDEIVPSNALALIQDVFGNYVIQKLFEHGTQVQKTVLATSMETHILSLSLQMYGCRVVQKAVEYILPEQQSIFVKELEPHVLRCVKDANGNHVIQKLIERVAPERLGFVPSFQGHVWELSTHPYGCRVLQRCFEHLAEDQTRPLLEELHKHTRNLMQDQFGNYVIQYVLEHGKPQDRNLIINQLRGQMMAMSRHKFASNVCEKALVTADSASRRQLIDEIMVPRHDGASPIITMMKDQYANYVLQRAMVVAEGDQRDELLSKVRPQLNSMRRYSTAYSKHLTSIERLLEKCTVKAGGEAPRASEGTEAA